MYIFIDESGNFNEGQKPYFVIGGFITNNPKKTAKLFRKWQHIKFPKKIRYKNEVKFTDTGLSEKLKLKTIEYFSKQDLRLFYVFLNKNNIPLEYRKKKGMESGYLYAEIFAEALHSLLPTSDLEFRIFRDQRHLKKLSQSEFNKIIKLDLLPSLPVKSVFQIEAIDSISNTNIQIADWICGALFRYYNQGKNGEEFFLLLKNNIVVSRELFKNYWGNKKFR